MNRRFFKSLTLWILPLLLTRALIPTGYMLMSGDDGLRLMFCPTVTSFAGATNGHTAQPDHDAGMHAAHAGHQHDHDHSGAHEHAPCPFSLAASAALSDLPVAAPVAVVAAQTVNAFPTTPAVSAGPIRADRIRGPPQFS